MYLKERLKIHVVDTGKKVKYQFWNNTGISVVLYWGIIGMFTRIPTLEKWYIYQCWHVTIVSQHWEIIILIGISLEVLFCFTNLGILAQFPHLGKCSFSLENCWNIYFVLPTLVYCNDLPILRNVVIYWKTIGIVIFLYQLWYTRTIFQHWKVLVFTGKSLEYSFYFNNLDILEELDKLNKLFFIEK